MDFAFGLALFGVVLGAVSTVLHFVAPRTAWKGDDKILDGVDFVKDKVLPVAEVVAPSMSTDKPVGFDTTGARDHRTK